MEPRMSPGDGVMTAPVLVTGGTGMLGRLVVPRLHQAGRRVRVLSRHGDRSGDGAEHVTGDLLADAGIEAAVAGVETVVHLAGVGANAKGDEEATRHLVRATRRAGARHLVCISVIGADRVPLGYFRHKLATERVVAGSGLPWTTLRVAQVHDLVLTMMRAMAKLPVIPAPPAIRLEPVDAAEVAARLVELTFGEPAGMVPDLAGPRIYRMADLIRAHLLAGGKRRLTLPVPMPGKVGRAYRAGENLSRDKGARGKRTWEDFLVQRVREGTAAESIVMR
jgi:uncharacterized protein YbjT (DUF2867 family)